MYKRYLFFAVLALFISMFVSSTSAQQILDSANVLYIDNGSDNYTTINTQGTILNDPVLYPK